MLFINIMPLVQLGLVNLIPDPWDFDVHLRETTMRMAQDRAVLMKFDPKDGPGLRKTIDEDVVHFVLDQTCGGSPDLFRDLFKYLVNLEERGAKPNREAQLSSRLSKTHVAAQSKLGKLDTKIQKGEYFACFYPAEFGTTRSTAYF